MKSVLNDVDTPEDHVIAACDVGERRRLGDVEQHRRAVGQDRDPARALQRRVVQPAAHHARAALDPLDVPVDAGVERENVRAVAGDLVVLEVDQVDVLGQVGQEDLAACP